MKRVRTGLLVFLILILFSGIALSESESYIIKADLLKAEYGYDIKWETVTKDEASLARFAALCLRDMEATLTTSRFDPSRVTHIYIYESGGYPGFYIHTLTEDWLVFLIGIDMVSAYQITAIPESMVSEFVTYMEENGYFATSIQVDREKTKEFMSYEPETAESVRAEGGAEAIFRCADFVLDFKCGWSAFLYRGEAGYINPSGEFLDGGWNYVQTFDEKTGVAVVYRGEVKSTGLPSMQTGEDGLHAGVWGLIDREGNEILPCIYDVIDTPSKEGYYRVRTKEKEYQYYDLDTKSFFTPEDSSIVYLSDLCNDGLIPAFKGTLDESGNANSTGSEGTWGYVDKKGKTVIPCIYESVGKEWYNGLSCAKKNRKYGVIDREGKMVIPFTWDYISLDYGLFIASKDKNKYLLDGNGAIVQDLNVNHAFALSEKYISLFDTFENDGGMIDITGNVILPREYYSINLINDHEAKVGKAESKDSKGYGVINYITGEIVVPMVYEDISQFYDGMCAFKQLGYYGFMDESYKAVIPPQYIDYSDFSEGYAAVKDEEIGWIIIDHEGNRVY